MYVLPVAVVQSSSNDGACYVLPVLWMTSCFHIMVHKQSLRCSGYRRATRHPLPERYRLARIRRQTIWLRSAAGGVVMGRRRRLPCPKRNSDVYTKNWISFELLRPFIILSDCNCPLVNWWQYGMQAYMRLKTSSIAPMAGKWYAAPIAISVLFGDYVKPKKTTANKHIYPRLIVTIVLPRLVVEILTTSFTASRVFWPWWPYGHAY